MSPIDPELFELLERNFGAINTQFVAMDRRLTEFQLEVRNRFDAVTSQFEEVGSRFEEVGSRFDAADRRFAEFRLEVRDRFDRIEQRLAKLETDYALVVEALGRIERHLVDETTHRRALERQVEDLKTRVAALQSRIEEIEQQLRR